MRPMSEWHNRLRARGAAHVTTMARAEEGQAIIIVALSALVLFGVLALVIDFGYGLTQRRVMVNAAESAALGAGKLLATHVRLVGGEIHFTVNSDVVLKEAGDFANANRSFVAPAPNYKLDLWYGNETAPTTGIWTQAVKTIPPQSVPLGTVYVRTSSDVKYRSFIAGVLGFPQMEAAGTARVRLSGSDSPLSTPIWPMVRHYNPADFNTTTCADPCTNLQPVTFWSPQAPDMVYGSMKGLADFSRYSTSEPGHVPQLITGWDNRYSTPTAYKSPDMGGTGCGSQGWNSAGSTSTSDNKQCSVPNWFFYGFGGETGGGQVSLTKNWENPPDHQEAPSALPARPGVCDGTSGRATAIAPSCANSAQGDWVETVEGNMATNMSAAIRALIQGPEGATDFRSNQLIPGSHSQTYGRYIVRLVYMWDCAEEYGHNHWNLVGNGADCSQLDGVSMNGNKTRVHLFTYAPFIFYEGLLDSSAIGGFWGVGFGDASNCTICRSALNAFSNTAYIIPDE